MFRAKVNIETAKRAYKSGEIIEEDLNAKDIDFLKRKGFIAAIDEDREVRVPEADADIYSKHDPVAGINLNFEGAEESDEAEYRDEDALKKMTKEEIVVYAAEIGLKLDGNSLKADLINAVLNYQEEGMAE